MNLISLLRPTIAKLTPYSSARSEFKGKAGVFLDANENPYGELNRYPDPYQLELKNALALEKKTNPANIFIGNGSDEVIDLCLRIFCEPGRDKALTFSPTYGMYEVSASINNVELIQLPLTTDFQIDLNKLNTALQDSSIKILFLCSPNNPTGNILKDTQKVLEKFKGIVVIDEAYIDFASCPSWIEKLEEYPNLIISQTLSKAWGLAGARIGLAFASEEIINILNNVKPPYNVSALNQQAAIRCIQNKTLFLKNVSLIILERKRMLEMLNRNSLILKIYPTDANFILVQVPDANKLYHDLVVNRVITRNRNSVIRNCIRITIGTPEENNLLIDCLSVLEKEYKNTLC